MTDFHLMVQGIGPSLPPSQEESIIQASDFLMLFFGWPNTLEWDAEYEFGQFYETAILILWWTALIPITGLILAAAVVLGAVGILFTTATFGPFVVPIVTVLILGTGPVGLMILIVGSPLIAILILVALVAIIIYIIVTLISVPVFIFFMPVFLAYCFIIDPNSSKCDLRTYLTDSTSITK